MTDNTQAAIAAAGVTEGDRDMLTLIAAVRHAVDDLERAIQLGVHRNPHH